MSDITHDITSNIVSFADDTRIFNNSISKNNDSSALQSDDLIDLLNIYNWASDLALTLMHLYIQSSYKLLWFGLTLSHLIVRTVSVAYCYIINKLYLILYSNTYKY